MFDTTNADARVALFLDIENFAGFCAELGVEVDLAPVLANLPKPLIMRSFGDIAALPTLQFSRHRIRRMLQLHHVIHEDVPYISGNKNGADMRLIVAAMALTYARKDLTHAVIVSGDRDFWPLAQHLREIGLTVVGVGPTRHMVGEVYKTACDYFLFLDEMVELPASVVVEHPREVPSIPQPEQAANAANAVPESPVPKLDVDCLIAAIHGVQADGQPTYASQVAAKMRLMFPELDVKKIGGFKRFCVDQQASTGRVQIDTPKNANFLLWIPGDTGSALKDLAEDFVLQQVVEESAAIEMPTEMDFAVAYAASSEPVFQPDVVPGIHLTMSADFSQPGFNS